LFNFFEINKENKFKKYYNLINGDWGLGIGDWGLGVGGATPNPQPHTPTPQPNFFFFF